MSRPSVSVLPAIDPSQLTAVFDQIFSRWPLGVALIGEAQTVLRVNQAFARMLGYSPDELRGKTASELTHPDDVALTEEAIRRLRNLDTDAFRTTKRYLARDGSVVWGDACVVLVDVGEVIAIALVADITERKRMEEALVRSSERFELLARAVDDLVYEWDLGTDSVTWSELIHSRYGYPDVPEVRTLRFWEEAIHPDDRGATLAALRRSLEGTDTLWSFEYRFRTHGGEWKSVLDRGHFVRDEQGRAVRMIGVMVDITELKRVHARLRQADRLASVGTLAAGVAHEINNPLAWTLNNLSVVRSALAALGTGGVSHPELQRAQTALNDAFDGAERVARIVRDLKTFARPDDENRTAVSLETVIEAALALANCELRHRARVVREYARPPAPPVWGNESRLGQVFLNLIVNAAQALPEGEADRNEVRVGVRPADDGRVEAWVSDTGRGIAPEIAPRLFEPFFTTRAGEGTGLGLSICHGIVTAHGGEIRVDAVPGDRTTFRVFLPAAENQSQPVTAPAQQPPPAERQARILVLDDEPLIGRALRRALVHHRVEVETRPEQVLERLGGGERWDLILCDVMMPEMSGMEFFAALQESAPDACASVVFMTGGAFTPRAAEFFASVNNPRLEKPFHASEVERLLKSR